MSNFTLVGAPATAADSERVWRMPSRSVRVLSYQYPGWSLRWNDSGVPMAGSGLSSVGFHGTASDFFPSDVDDAPASPARLALPTTVASRNRAGSPNSFRLDRRRGRIATDGVTTALPLSPRIRGA